ncbi:L-rhamnose mutarotase [Hymenobacter monticola]|uniref:L-rhamnose mutarotase n=1 Tax=Hymenobacter monticola TaxID=1705399 RepID=A0ABY4B001_9BACT|nr:L-rhamnose mutarotase [Hymenobacter monticola]UOE32124.1 L-rhamnose mutarotase [Hymenobacter monticola]
MSSTIRRLSRPGAAWHINTKTKAVTLPGLTTADTPRTGIMQRWWAYMGDLMKTSPDNPSAVQPLARLFRPD